MSKYILYSDGASRGNPGNAGAASILLDQSGRAVGDSKLFLGVQTNNVAEYKGLLIGLDLAIEKNVLILECRMDSQLVVKQMKGEYKVKHAILIPLYLEAKEKIKKFMKVTFTYVPRKDNARADALANLAIDQVV